MKKRIQRAVLAYSGGLDTSIIVPWLKQHYGCEVVCYCSDVGQGAELDGLEARAKASGADQVVVEDLRETFVRDFCFPALRAGAVYEGKYLLGTSLARPLIAARQVACALAAGADAVAHGCTGKGNDQVRFELAYLSLAPHLALIAPWREWDIVSREDALRYAAEHGITVPVKKGDLFSRDSNLWHISHEGGPLEDPANAAPESMWKLTAGPYAWPAEPETVTIRFERGTPVALDGVTLHPVALVETLNTLAGRHGVGRVDLVESRLVGMKSRGAYETPAGTVLMEALEDLCRLVLPHDLLRTRLELSHRMAELIYNGQWFSPLREALQAFVDKAMESASGEITVELHRGHATVVSRTSDWTLYNPALASFDMTGYDAQDSRGFIKLFGLPLATAAQRKVKATAKAEAKATAKAEAKASDSEELVAAKVNGANGPRNANAAVAAGAPDAFAGASSPTRSQDGGARSANAAVAGVEPEAFSGTPSPRRSQDGGARSANAAVAGVEPGAFSGTQRPRRSQDGGARTKRSEPEQDAEASGPEKAPGSTPATASMSGSASTATATTSGSAKSQKGHDDV